MQIEYKNNKVLKECTHYKTMTKIFPPDIVKALQILLSILETIENLAAFINTPVLIPYSLEKLKGDRQYQMSLRVKPNKQYRLIFECLNTDIKDDYKNMTHIMIIEISKHYSK